MPNRGSMDTVYQGDLVIVEAKEISGQRILASTEYWEGIDELSVENSKTVTFTKPWQAKVTSVSFGRATAVPSKTTNKHGISAGDEIELQLTTLSDGHPTSTDPSLGMHQLIAPEATLGDTVSAIVYQIHDGTAYLALKEIIEEGLSIGDRVAVEVHRLEEIGFLDLNGFDRLPVALEDPVLIGGHAIVELTNVDDSLAGRIVDLDFVPKSGDLYKMVVKRDSAKALTNWEEVRGIDTVALSHESIASDEAIIRIVEVGETFKGEIIKYCNPPQLGDEIRASVNLNQREAYSQHPEYEIQLDKPPELDGEAVVEIQNEVAINDGFVPPLATVLSYEQLPTEGEIVNARVDEDGRTATILREEHQIVLTRHASNSGMAKIKLTDVAGSDLRGHVERFFLQNESANNHGNSGSPFGKGFPTRNDDLTGRKL